MEIGIRELKDRLSEILHRANNGESITITHHGQPLCQIEPLLSNEFVLPDYLKEAAVEGWLKPATRSGLKKIKGFKPKNASPTSTEILREMRRERHL